MNKKIISLALVVLFMAGALADGEGATAIQQKLDNILGLIVSIAQGVAVVVLAFGGLKFMTAGNDPLAKEQAKQIMMAAIVGLVIVTVADPVIKTIAGT